MPKRFFSDAKRIVRKLISGDSRLARKVAQLTAEIEALNRRIEVQDGDIAFAQSILARYTAEMEGLMRENMSLRKERLAQPTRSDDS